MQVNICAALPAYFNFLIHFQVVKVRKIMVSKYEHLNPSVGFPDKVTPDIDFTDEAVVQCHVSVVKILL